MPASRRADADGLVPAHGADISHKSHMTPRTRVQPMNAHAFLPNASIIAFSITPKSSI